MSGRGVTVRTVRTLRLAGLLVPLALVAAAGPSPAAAAVRHCQSLKGRDLVPSRLVKVVDAGTGTRHRYLGCTQPSGDVRTLRASRPGGRLQFLDSRGAFLVVRDPVSRRTDVADVASGRRVKLAGAGGKALVTRAGTAAALVGTRLTGYDYDGTSYSLAAGPVAASSLLHGKADTVSWKAAGVMQTADLDAPAVPCAKLAGHLVRSTPGLRVVSFTFRDEYLVGEIDGYTTITRACLTDGGPVRVLGEADVASDGVQGGSSFTVPAAAGSFVVEDAAASDSQGDYAPETLTLHDLATGRRVQLWGNSDAGGPGHTLGDLVTGPLLSAGGQTAASFAVDNGDTIVVGFSAAGNPSILDRAPGLAIDAKSLRLSGTMLDWTNAGAPHTADLATLG